MLARLTLLIASVLAAALWSAEASAERRVAMVIGNSAYRHATALRNPGNDASDVAQALKGLGFEVLLGVDLDQQGFAQQIEQFARMLDEADVGLFFYAGHGVQMNDKNYLVSTNARLENEFLLSSETIELDSIVRLMESKAPINLVFLDACRNNPLTDNLRRSLTALKRSAQLGRGLARMEPTGRDTLIAFSAAPGQEAADGADRNSPFTSALLRHIGKPGLEVSVMLKDVAADVRRDTRNSQRPQQLSDMGKAFYFARLQQVEATKTDAAPLPVPAPAPAVQAAAAPSPDDRALDVAFWSAASSANDCEAIRAYLQRFPAGTFVELARLSERRLCGASRQVTVSDAAPAEPPAVTLTPSAPAPVPPTIAATAATAAAVTPAAPAAVTPAAPVSVAALPDTQKSVPPTIKLDASGNSEQTRAIQLELIRLGCGPNEASGQWSSNTREGLRRFNKAMHARLDLNAPSSDTVAALQRQTSRACPLTCDRGYAAKGDTCVAIKVEPTRKSRRAERVERRRAPAHAREAAPAAAPAPVAQQQPMGGPMFLPMMGMGGGFRFGFGRH
jgi:uncharacterized caspase-like protein